MAKTRQLKKRIKAVGNIRRITKTMQMIATAKFSAASQRSVASRPYTDTLFDLLTQLAASLGDIQHPLLARAGTKEKRPGKALTLVLTSDRGLCGPYNGSVLRTSMAMLRSNADAKSGLIELVGKKGVSFLKYNAIPVAQQHTQFGDKPKYDDVRALAENYIARFVAGEVSVVRIIYMKYISAGKQVPTVMQLLPFQPDATPAKKNDSAPSASGIKHVYEFTPGAAELLNDILPAGVKALLFQAFNDAIVSEHVARMIAMKSATDNAGKAGKNITRIYNRARQAQITTELTEIISGAAALE
jgi:F-type H+-transporting ATPase subunit gamma